MKRKILVYSLLYMVVSIASAFGAIKLSTVFQNHALMEAEKPPYQLVQVVENLSENKKFDVDLNADIVVGGQKQDIDINIKLDVDDPKNVNMQAEIILTSQNKEPLNLNVSYFNKQIYLDLLGNKFTFKSDKVITGLTSILDSVFANLGFNLKSLHVDDILVMLKDLTETKTKKDITLDIKLPIPDMPANLILICDKLYNIQKLSLPTLTLGDEEKGKTEITVDGKFTYPEIVDFKNQFDNYIDITNMVHLISDVASRENLAFNIDATVNNNQINALLNFDVKTLNTQINLNLGNELSANLMLIDDKIFAEIANAFIQFDLNNLDKVNDLLTKHFNIDLPVDFILQLIDSIRDNGLLTALTNLDLSNIKLPEIDLANLDLSFLNNITINSIENTTSINIKDVANIEFEIDDNEKLALINVSGKQFNVSAQSVDFVAPSLSSSEESYADISLLLPVIDKVIGMTKHNNFYGTANVKIADLELPIVYDVYVNEQISANIETSLFGQQIVVRLLNNTIYMEMGNIKLRFALNEIDKLIDILKVNFNININTDELINKMKTIFDINSYPSLIKHIKKNENNIELNLIDKILILIKEVENELNVDLTFDNISLKATVNAMTKDMVIPEIDNNSFVDINLLVEKIANIVDYIKTKQFDISADISTKDLNISTNIKLDLTQKFALGMQASIEQNQQIIPFELAVLNDQLYFTFGGLDIKINTSNIKDLLTLVANITGMDLSKIQQILDKNITKEEITKIIEQLKNKINPNDLPKFIAFVKEFKQTDNTLTFVLDSTKIFNNSTAQDIVINCTTVNNNISSITISNLYLNKDLSDKLDLNLQVNEFTSSPSIDPNRKYIDMTNIIYLAQDILSRKNIAFDIVASVNNKNINANINIDFDKLNLSAVINLTESLSAKLFLIQNDIYLEVNNIFFKFSLEEIDKINVILKKYANFELPKEIILNVLDAIRTKDISKLIPQLADNNKQEGQPQPVNVDFSMLDNIDINSTANDIFITIKNFGQININLTNDKKLNNITIKSTQFNLDIQTSQYVEKTISQPVDKYINMVVLTPVVDKVLEVMQNNIVSGKIQLTLPQISLDINYEVAIKGELLAKLNTNIYGQFVSITYYQNWIYVEVSETKLMFNINNIDALITFLNNTFKLNINMEQIMEFINNMLNPEINPQLINSVQEAPNSLNIVMLKNIFLSISAPQNILNVEVEYKDIVVSLSCEGTNKEIVYPVIDQTQYTNIIDLLPTIENIYNYVTNKQFFIGLNAQYKQINIQGFVNYQNNNLSASVDVNYNGLITVKAIILNNKVYISTSDIRFVFDLNDMQILKEFALKNLNIDIDKIIADLQAKLNGLKNIDIPNLVKDLSLNLTLNNIKAKYLDKLALDVTLEKDMISKANIKMTDLNANIQILNAPVLITVSTNYLNIVEVLNDMDAVFAYLQTKQYDINALISSSDTTINANVKLDIIQKIIVSAKINSQRINENPANISLNIEDGMLYADYKGLCLKIDNQNVKELLVIVLESLGIDPSILPFIQDVDLNLDFSQLQKDFASVKENFTVDKVIKMIGFVNTIQKINNNLVITLSGEKLYNNAVAQNIIITLTTENKTLKSLSITNIYKDNTLQQKFDIDVSFNKFVAIDKVDKTKNYIDISGTNELVKAMVNMSTKKDFNIKGSLALNGELIGIQINKVIPYEIKFKLNSEHKLEAHAVIGEIPVITGINNDVPYEFGDVNGGQKRYLHIYYKDDAIYLYRIEDIATLTGTRKYEKCTKTTVQAFMANPMYYIQYSIGLSDKIMNAITGSMGGQKPAIDYSKIINSFTVVNNTNFKLSLNMKEITGNTQIDSLNVDLGLAKDRENKNYLHNLSLSLYMPLASVFKLTVSTNDTQIVNYEQPVDLTKLYNFVSNYKYDFEVRMQANNGNWTVAA